MTGRVRHRYKGGGPVQRTALHIITPHRLLSVLGNPAKTKLDPTVDLAEQIPLALDTVAAEARKARRAYTGRTRNRITLRSALAACRRHLEYAERLIAETKP